MRKLLKSRVVEVVEGICASLGATGSVEFVADYPAVINRADAIALSAEVASEIVGDANVDADSEPVLGSEDFAFMLEEIPGCYIFIGNGAGEGNCMIHNPGYDFNDDAAVLGATYWVRLAQAFLSRNAG